MISASKSTLCLNNLKILRSKVTKNLTNLRKKFCEFPPWVGQSDPIYICLSEQKKESEVVFFGGKKHEISQTEEMFFSQKLIRKFPFNMFHINCQVLAEILEDKKI